MKYIARRNLALGTKNGIVHFEANKIYTFEQIGEDVDISNFEKLSDGEAAALVNKGAKKQTAAPSKPAGGTKEAAPEGAEEVI